VLTTLSASDIGLVTDALSVEAPVIINQDIEIKLLVERGPDAATVVTAAETAIQSYADSRHRVGYVLRTSGICAAAQVAGVESMTLIKPTADVDPGERGAIYVSSITITTETYGG